MEPNTPHENNQITNSKEENIEATNAPKLDSNKLQNYFNILKLEQNLPLGILAGCITSIVGASIWAIVTIATNFQIGWMAVGVGFLVGYGIRYFGKGIDKIFGILGGIFALFGCILGNFFSLIGLVSIEEGYSFIETLTSIDYSLVPTIMVQTGSPIDLLFYGIAVYEGYRFSFRVLKEEDIVNATK